MIVIGAVSAAPVAARRNRLARGCDGGVGRGEGFISRRGRRRPVVRWNRRRLRGRRDDRFVRRWGKAAARSRRASRGWRREFHSAAKSPVPRSFSRALPAGLDLLLQGLDGLGQSLDLLRSLSMSLGEGAGVGDGLCAHSVPAAPNDARIRNNFLHSSAGSSRRNHTQRSEAFRADRTQAARKRAGRHCRAKARFGPIR